MSGELKIHPLANIIPEMQADEYAGLCHDIKANGLYEDIWLYEGKILDGRHRYRACLELFEDYGTRKFVGTYEEARAFVLAQNIHRRMLTFEQKQAAIYAALKRDPAQSDRAIANIAKVSPTTVGKARQKLVEQGKVSTVDTITGKDGVKQPAKKKQTTRERQGLPPAPPPLPTAKDIAAQVGMPALAPVIEALDAQIKTNSSTHRPAAVAALAEQLEPLLVKLSGGTLRPEYAAIVDELKECGRRHPAKASPSQVAGASHKLKQILIAAHQPTKERTKLALLTVGTIADDATTPAANMLPVGPPVSNDSLWVWGRLRDFERMSLLAQHAPTIFRGMTDTMQADVVRILPVFLKWMARLTAEVQP